MTVAGFSCGVSPDAAICLSQQFISHYDVILRRAQALRRTVGCRVSPTQSIRTTCTVCTGCIPANARRTLRARTVPHAGFAAIQDDIAFWGNSVVVSTRDPWAQHGLNQICELVGGELIAFDVSHQLSLAINDGCVQGMIHQAFIGEIIDPE